MLERKKQIEIKKANLAKDWKNKRKNKKKNKKKKGKNW